MKHQHCPPFETNLAKNGNTPCSFFFLSFGCRESGPNDSTRVRRHTGIIRRTRVKIFIQLMGAFGSNFPNFRAIWLGTTEPKLQNVYEAADQNIRTFTSKPRLPMTNREVLNRFRTFAAVKLHSVLSIRARRRPIAKFWQEWSVYKFRVVFT